MLEEINKDLINALKEKDEFKINTLRLLLNALKNKAIEKRAKSEESLTLDEELDVLVKEANKRKEAIEFYKKGNREDLALKEKKELEIIEQYLPKQLSEAEVKDFILEKVKEFKKKEEFNILDKNKNFGKLMGVLAKELKGRADNQLISRLLKEILEQD